MKTLPNQTASESAPSKRHSTAEDLFPDTLPRVTIATSPKPGTRPDEALNALLTGPQNQAEYDGQGWRLAAYVQQLEDRGWRFITRDIVRPGCRRPIAEYRIDRSDPGTAAALAARGFQ
ncbi:MAG: hypothetical protein JNM54_14470 [Candidatus Accumulibacter sp.]|jgi:hypothetical protein|uniref:hypothetical protein n=1 Tax=Accumulibacter sp. TaxID=2053492 RepID=UPI001A4EC347|nr:hypothetical protein [Accumulibacter sp.]MBL8369098.1 hypothetical protein [Accumulibacter sp.]